MKPVKVALYGFDQRSMDRLKNTFLINYRGKCVLSTPDEASRFIVDLEGVGDNANALLASLSPADTILLSDSANGPRDFQTLVKPVKLHLLQEALIGASPQTTTSLDEPLSTSAAQSLQQHFREPTPTHKKNGARKTSQDERYNPDEYFVTYLLNILNRNPAARIVLINTWDLKRLIIDRHANRIYSEISKNALRNLSAIPLAKNLADAITSERLSSLPTAEELEGTHEMELEHTLWELAYNTSRGRLPKNFDSTQKYYLSHWPNFTRLPAMDNGMRIAAVWAGEPHRLEDLAARLAIPTAEVSAFFAGVSALGLTGIAKRQSDHIVERQVAPRQKAATSNILKTLLGHIGVILKPHAAMTEHQKWSHGESS